MPSWFLGKASKGRQFARESVDEPPTGPVSKDLRRRVGRALEWYIIGLVAKNVPPAERLFLLYEVSEKAPEHHPRIRRAMERHGRAQLWMGEFALVGVTRAELEHVIGAPEWMDVHVSSGATLGENEGRCVIVRDLEQEPEVLVFDSRGSRRRE
jgi:hypothetical protein